MYSKGSDYYSPAHYIKKSIWILVYYCFFRYSPRLLYAWRNFLLRLFGAKIGKQVRIFPSATITYPWNLEIGDYSIISWKVIIYNLGPVKIGEKTLISQFSHICAGDHDYKNPKFTLLMPSISIGSNVWIGTEAFIGPRVIINDYAVIGARSVVVKNVEPGCVIGGNPARILKKRDLANESE